MDLTRRLIERNRAWAEAVDREDPGFFARLAARHAPEVLWIGCSDARVPANELTGTDPGDVFVHRNIANQVIHTDINCQTVIQYGIEALGIRHVIVCGHYGCGGVKAAMESRDFGLLHNWLRAIKDLYQLHAAELDSLAEDARNDRLCELNVEAQVKRLAHSATVQNAWASGQEVAIHGWIYGLQDGLIRDLEVDLSGIDHVPAIYHTR